MKSNQNIEATTIWKTIVTVGAAAVAGVAAYRMRHKITHWRDENLDFDFPIEDQLFIGWGGGRPNHTSTT